MGIADHRASMESFRPPEYVASLIAAINDAARSAQAGALAFSAIGFYLLATAFSTTDEDLLRESTTVIAQLGVQMPVIVSFAMAPVVFVLLHVFILVRYDMLAVNLRQLRADLDRMVPLRADQERCLQLLANVEFVQALIAPRGSPLRSVVHQVVAWTLIVVMPVLVLTIVELSALRLQMYAVTGVQKIALVIDIMLLGWFLRRYVKRSMLYTDRDSTGDRRRKGMFVFWALSIVVLAAVFRYANIAGPEDATVEQGRDSPNLEWQDVLSQPLDFLVCPRLRWGCRYLDIEHRTAIARVWNANAIAELRSGEGDLHVALAGIEGLYLGNRSLRFADFNGSSLYAANFRSADLVGATFKSTDMEGADLSDATLAGANLRDARLQVAMLVRTGLQGADLQDAQLQGATLFQANLEGADLSDAHLDGAILWMTDLMGAEMLGAEAPGAYLSGAYLQCADLRDAVLDGADLSGASLVRSELGGTKLQGADLRGTRLYGARIAPVGLDEQATSVDISLADMRGADVVTPTLSFTRTKLLDSLFKYIGGGFGYIDIPGERGADKIQREFEQCLALPVVRTSSIFSGKSGSVLVDNLHDQRLVGIDTSLFTTDRVGSDAYNVRLAEFLADRVAADDPAAANGIFNRVFDANPLPYEERRAIGCQLLAGVTSGRVSFSDYENHLVKLRKTFRDCTGSQGHTPPTRE